MLKVCSEVGKSDVIEKLLVLTDRVAMAAQKQCCSIWRPVVFWRHLAVKLRFIGRFIPTSLCFVSRLVSYIHHGDARENHPATDPGHPPGARWTGEEETRTRCKYTLRQFSQIWTRHQVFHHSETRLIATCILAFASWGLAKLMIAVANAGYLSVCSCPVPSTSGSSR